MTNNNLQFGQQLIVFCHVVEQRNFTAAALKLGLSKGYVSEIIKKLELSLGQQLINRSTRSLSLTYAGEELYVEAANITKTAEKAMQRMSELSNKPAGNLRITAPTACADNVIAPKISEFLVKYPEINIELIVTSKTLDLVKDNIDVAIRLTHNPPLDRVAKHIANYNFTVCASKDYLQAKKMPLTPRDLSVHQHLVYATEANNGAWPFVQNEVATRIAIKSRLSCDTVSSILNSALAGIGIARLPSYVVKKYIASGELIALLQEYAPPPIPIYAIYTYEVRTPPSLQAFLEFIAQLRF